MSVVTIEDQDIETSLTEATVILNLDFGKFVNRRQIESDSENIQTDIDRNSLHVGIDLIDAKELRACYNFQANLKASLKDYCVPSFLRGGMFLVKLEAIQIVSDMIRKAKVDFVPVVQTFADVVDVRKEEARDRLKGEFKPELYPTREQVLAVFRIEHRWLSMSTPTSLKKVSVEFFNQEKLRAEESLRATTDGITALLAAEAKGLTEHLVDRLTPDELGERKQLRKSAVDNITKFLTTFKLRSIGTSDALNDTINQINGLLEGVDAKDLRMNETLRADIATKFTEINGALDRLIQEKPKRFMSREEAS